MIEMIDTLILSSLAGAGVTAAIIAAIVSHRRKTAKRYKGSARLWKEQMKRSGIVSPRDEGGWRQD